jgi:hypothetical protein
MADTTPGNVSRFLKADVQDIIIYKHQKTEKMSIMPQFLDINIYTSLFQPIMKAELMLNDTIALHTHFPLSGEEIIEVTIKGTKDDPTDPNNDNSETRSTEYLFVMEFMSSDVRKMIPDDTTRSTYYVLQLYSKENFGNAKTNVMRAFAEPYDQVAQKLLKEYFKANTQIKTTGGIRTTPHDAVSSNFEKAKGNIPTVIPNMHPIECISWLAGRAVPEDSKHINYVFFQSWDGFHFETLQKMMEKKVIGQGVTSGKGVDQKVFIYLSNMATNARNALSVNLPNLDQHTITGIQLNKRYSTLEKIVGGFFDNEYYEIDIWNRRVNNKQTEVKTKPEFAINTENGQLNTNNFINSAKANTSAVGQKTRVRFAIGQNGGDDPKQENWFADKFTNGSREMVALSQIQLTISLPGDTRIQPGQMIKILVPEFHGFNQVKDDAYISGDYLVVNVKHTISAGLEHFMVLDCHRDTYNIDLKDKMDYALSGKQ